MTISIKTRVTDSIIASMRRFDLTNERKSSVEIERWLKAGRPVPPPHAVKKRIVLCYSSAFRTTTFIETGTLLGDMDYAVRDAFQALFP